MSARWHNVVRRFARDERATTLVELAIVLPLFLLIFFALIDFGRLGSEFVLAEKAIQRAARIAVVRPPACNAIDPADYEANARGPVGTGVPPEFGSACNSGTGICEARTIDSCAGDLTNPTVAEIWAAVSGLLPTYATPANLRFEYRNDNNLNFLGGPYVPIVTVEMQNLNFRFVTPLGGLAQLAGGAGFTPTATFAPISVSLPAEDLAHGTAG